MTSGNHIWDKKEIIEYITKENLLLRPANFPVGHARAWATSTVKAGPHKVAVLNLMGRVFMTPIDCPFRKADEDRAASCARRRRSSLVDMHCEATSRVAGAWAGISTGG